MSIRRQGRLHQTVAAQQSEIYWDYQPGQRVMTIDGPGRVIAASDGPFPGSEEYEIQLEGGLGGGTYGPSQITAATSVEAVEHHTADQDYPELGTILYDRPDPATVRHTAELGSGGGDSGGGDGGEGGSAPARSSAEVASGGADENHVGWAPEYNNALYHDWRIAVQDPGPNDIARSLDKFRDEQEERHQDDARYVPDFKPLQLSSLKPEEHSGWMFMERKDPQPMHGGGQTPPLFSYKHGITRTPLHLDDEGQSYGMVAGRFAGARAAHHDLNSKGHYRMLEQLGAKPETAYDNDYIKGRNQRLTEHGWNVVSSLRAAIASTLPDDHPDKVYLRFGHWPEDERSENYVTGGREEGVSVYDLDHKGEPMDPDPHYSRGHEHDEHCEPDCDLDWNNSEFGNDTHEEMNGRVSRAEKGRRNNYDLPHQVGHLVKGKMTGIGHDGEPLLNNVRRVGDWIDHRHHFIPTAEPHHFARGTDDEDYEPPEEHPGITHTASSPDDDGVTAEVWRPFHDNDEEDVIGHLVNHHGQNRDFIGDAYDMHDRLHDEADDEDYMGPEPEGEPHEHHDVSREYHAQPWEGRDRAGGSSQEEDHRRFLAPGGGHDYKPVPRTIQSLNRLLVTAVMDPGFRFHVTAAWRDVQAKAVRIRKSGGVNITHASEGYVIANVKGDHHVYETGLQRVPGRRTAVAVYSCGCKWGAYHWGADDDMSRFAGRMCSHALALQYEAQARGMFGRDVTVDDTKPRWVPSKVVVKYDIDDGKNIQARSSLVVPEQSPLLACIALADDDDPGLGMVLASVNDLFGDNSGMTEPTAIDPAGPTTPWNTEESPASAGMLAGGEPANWGRINSPSMYPRLSAAVSTEAFWQRLSSILAGVETVFHEEPEAALPSTDGDDHTASRSKGWTLWRGEGSHLDAPLSEETKGRWFASDPISAEMYARNSGGHLYSVDLADHEGEEHVAGWDHVKSQMHIPGLSLLVSSEVAQRKVHADSCPTCSSPRRRRASMSDVNLSGGSGIADIDMQDGESLNPENESIQSQGGAHAIVAEFQRSAGARHLMDSGKPGDTSNSDIAGAAEAYLQKTAASATEFSLAEREALINESPGMQASNTDRLDIAGTHYADLETMAMSEEDDYLWMA